MREFADELRWWKTPRVEVRPALSQYGRRCIDSSQRLRVEKKSEQQTLERLYNEAVTKIHRGIHDPLTEAMKFSGLELLSSAGD